MSKRIERFKEAGLIGCIKEDEPVNMEWKPIDPLGDFEAKRQEEFLLKDENGFIHTGFTARDYYDAKYWFPMPLVPYHDVIITNDACIPFLLKDQL